MFLTVGNSSLDSFVGLLSVLVMFILVLALSYITTKWLGNAGVLQQRSKNISVVETYKLGPNKLLQIVKVGGRYFVLGVGKDTIEYLSEIPEEELNLEQFMALNDKNHNPESFGEIFSKISKKRCGDSDNK